MKYIMFHPVHRGEILPAIIQENIIAAAKRGKITKAGKRVMLVPDKRKQYRDKRGIRFKGYGSVRKSECIPLKSLTLGKQGI